MNRSQFQKLADRWPSAWVAREEIDRFSGGALTSKYCANLDSRGIGIKNRMRCGKKIIYSLESVLEFLESRTEVLD
jgi:hypothetical protein